MKTGGWILAGAAFLLVAACAPISTEKVAATARPTSASGRAERYWTSDMDRQMKDALAVVEAACSGAADCISTKLNAAWPATAQYQQHCQATTLKERAECLLEYGFWAKAGQKYNPRYAMEEGWASFDEPQNPTFRAWYANRLFACDPGMNKGQEFGDTCVRDAAKRDFSVPDDATKGCYYNDLSLASLCYWMAGFELYVQERFKALAEGT